MKSLHERRRNSVYMRVGAGTILAIIVWTVFGLVPGCSPDDPNCGTSIPSPQFENDWMEEPMVHVVYEEPTVFAKVQAVQQASLGDQRSTPTAFVSTVPTSIKVITPERPQVVGETTFLSHAPGFSVIETAFWKNDTWYLITSKPWSFPSMSLVVSNAPDHGQKIFTDDSVVQVMSPRQAEEAGLNLGSAEAVDGTSLIFNDRIYLDHYYHVFGEMFLGAWRAFTSIITDSGPVIDGLPEITNLVFAHVSPKTVFDHAGLNKFFFRRFFPEATWEFQPEWQARANSGKLYRFERVVIADRKCGHAGGGKGKPMDLAFELPVPERWLTDLKDRVLVKYTGPVTLHGHQHAYSKPVVTYLSRQTAPHRHFKGETHDALVEGLAELEEEGIAEVHIEEFTDADPKDEQVAKLSRTTILVGLHGNGLTNLVWMTPDAQGRSTVYEIQQKGMFLDDYAVLSEAVGIEHWIIGGRSETEYCQRSTCGKRGTDAGIKGGSKNYTLEVPELLHRIRQRLAVGDVDE